MSKELIEFFQQYGNVVVFLIAGGTVVAAVIGAVNAIVVALISARAAQQLALTNDHRKYRSTLTKEIITDVEKLFGQLRGIISARKEPGGEADYMVKLRGELVKRREAAVIYPTTGDELFDRASDLAHSIEDHARGVLIERRENAYEQLFILGRLLKRLRPVLRLAAEGYIYQLASSRNRVRGELAVVAQELAYQFESHPDGRFRPLADRAPNSH